MRWPFRRSEKRESNYTDALTAHLTALAGGSSGALATATGALEACAGLVGRAFMSAEVDGSTAITPAFLAMVARDLIRKGQSLHLLEVVAGEVRLYPAAGYDITGSEPDPSTWTYRLDLSTPSGNPTVNRPAESVLHFRYAVEAARPWRGLGPLQVAELAGKLSAETAATLADETSGPRGGFLPIPSPSSGEDTSMVGLRADVKGSKGALLMVESMASGFGAGASGAPADWMVRRFGADPPASLVALHAQAFTEVVSAVGVPAVLLSTQGSGAAFREAWRQLLHGLIAPLGKLVSSELSAKLDTPIRLTWDELRAADLQGMARSLKAFVDAGLDVTEAKALAGLE